MKKILIICLIMMIGISALSADTDKPIITVLDFETSEVAEAEMKSIINILSSGLFKTGCFTVIDVAQRETVLKELEFSMSGCTDESCMLEIGKMLSAELIVGGSMSRLGSKIVLSAKMIETETSRTMSTADGIYTDMDDLLENFNLFRDSLAMPYVGEVLVTEEAEPLEPPVPEEKAAINIPAIACAAGGVVGLGVGAYFLAVSLPLLFDYSTAQTAYDEAADGADFTALFDAAEAARLAAVEGNANVNFIIGASLAGGGLVLGIVSTILFLTDDAGPAVETAFIPVPGAATLVFRLRY